ncbi:MAG: hypothetical protein QG658_101 [Patescibacteria group bacterium]|nr:hypothetical protein [Patescibacteria group bacterium]
MNPTDPHAPQPNPHPEPPSNVPPSQPPAEVPVFRNPLAQGYEEGTAQLPPMAPMPAAEPAPQPPAPTPAPEPTVAPEFPQNPPITSPPASPVESPPPAYPVAPPAQPTVSELSNSPIKPAPVRLAPLPRNDDMHADGLQATSQAAPFGATPENVAPAPAIASGTPAVSKAPRKPIGLIVGVAVGVVVLLVAAIGGYAYFASQKEQPAASSSPTTAGSVRDKTEKPTQPFSEKISTDCYVAQSLTPVETQQNKDCALSITYGEQKISSIFVSALGQFDIATDENSSTEAQNSASEINTQKYLDALIADIIPKDLVTTREDIKVGGLDATKVVGKKDEASAVDVAYVFIILPEGDRTFGEKTFVAFIVTGAYNDDYSRKGFDQFLSTWSWK